MKKVVRLSEILFKTGSLKSISTSNDLLVKGSFITNSSLGIYNLLPLGLRVKSKIIEIIEKHLNEIGCSPVELSILQPIENMTRTKRLNGEVFTLKDRKDQKLLLAPTHEEEITTLVGDMKLTFKNLPLKLYQIGKKFRDEMRPKSGMLRGREFIMKDLYSFDKDVDSAMNTYNQVSEAYRKIFKEIGLNVVVAEADSGDIGGSLSHEYHLLSEGKLGFDLAGEDTVFVCEKCNFASNVEKIPQYSSESGKEHRCSNCSNSLSFHKAIEVGHTFFLDTKYSLPLESTFKSSNDTWDYYKMGCYGIGVSRLIAAIVEVSRDDAGIIWPKSIAPYHTVVLATKGCLESLDLLQTQIDGEWVLDDRNLSMKVKMKEALMVGYPKIVIAGDRFLKEGVFEVHDRKSRAVLESKTISE